MNLFERDVPLEQFRESVKRLSVRHGVKPGSWRSSNPAQGAGHPKRMELRRQDASERETRQKGTGWEIGRTATEILTDAAYRSFPVKPAVQPYARLARRILPGSRSARGTFEVSRPAPVGSI